MFPVGGCWVVETTSRRPLDGLDDVLQLLLGEHVEGLPWLYGGQLERREPS